MTVSEYMDKCQHGLWYKVETKKGIYNVLIDDDNHKQEYYYPLFNQKSYPPDIKTDEEYLEYIIENTDGIIGLSIFDTRYTFIVDALETKE